MWNIQNQRCGVSSGQRRDEVLTLDTFIWNDNSFDLILLKMQVKLHDLGFKR